MASEANTIVIGIDTGGTFTDIVLLDGEGRIFVRKVDNKSTDATGSIVRALKDLIDRENIKPEAVSKVVHCTTILGNSVIERKGPNCGLLTTRGFRDVLELGRQHNPVLYDIFWKKTPPLIPRRRCLEVDERVGADGSIVRPLDLKSVEHAIENLKKADVKSVAICLINACTNPTHEQAVAEMVRQRLPGVTVSLSSSVSPEWGEYERTSTTVTDAFLKPTFTAYIENLQGEMAAIGLNPELFFMQSAGSIAPVAVAVETPVYSLDSGPAASVVAAAGIGAAIGFDSVLAIEIGGTTAKSSLIENGQPARATETEIGTPVGSDGRALRGGGYVLRMPVIDAVEVGAGGGSIARVDEGGSLSVGPEGAGADPGPAAYLRGGVHPTLTDANLVLGYLDDKQLLGGSITLDRRAAEAAIMKHVAEPLQISVLEAAHSIRALANAVIARAVRAVSTERGRDVRKFALLAAGGGGPGHAAEIARALSAKSVVIPPFAGVFASFGLLWTPPERRVSQAVRIRLNHSDAVSGIERVIAVLKDQIGAEEGREPVICEEADVHYVGQFHDLTVPITRRNGKIDPDDIRKEFEIGHEKTYGYHSTAEHCEIRAVRLVAQFVHSDNAPRMSLQPDPAYPSTELKSETREIYFGPKLRHQSARLMARADVPSEAIQGPIVIPEYDTTIVVPPDFVVWREKTGALVLKNVTTGEGK